MGRIILEYFGLTIVCAILIGVIAYFIPAVSGSTSAVTTVVASMIAGQLYGRRTGQEVSSGFAWKVAGILTLLSLIAGAVALWYIISAQIPVTDDGLTLDGLSPGMMLGIFVFVGLLSLLAIRFSFRMGVKQGAKLAK